MRKILLYTALILTLCMPYKTANAKQNDAEPVEIKAENQLELIDIIILALQNNPQTRQAWLSTEIYNAQYKQQLSDYYPQITLSSSYSTSEKDYENYGVENSTSESRTDSISLSYLLFDFGQRIASVSEFKHKLKMSRYDENTTMQSLVYSVIEAYYDLFSAMSNEQAAKETEASSLAAFNAASLRYKLGLVPLTDKLQAETAYAQSQLDRQQAENEFKIKIGELNYLLNLDPNENVNLKTPNLNLRNNGINEDVQKLMETAIKQRPEILSKIEERNAANENLKSTKRQRYPTISLTGSYSEVDDMNTNDNDYNNSSVGISASIPLFTGGDIKNQIAKSRRGLDTIDSEMNDLEKEVKLDVWKTYQNYETAKATLKTSQKLLKSAQQTEKTTLGMYKNGKSSILDLLNSQSDLADAKKEFISAQHDLFITKANLIRAIGQNEINGR